MLVSLSAVVEKINDAFLFCTGQVLEETRESGPSMSLF